MILKIQLPEFSNKYPARREAQGMIVAVDDNARSSVELAFYRGTVGQKAPLEALSAEPPRSVSGVLQENEQAAPGAHNNGE